MGAQENIRIVPHFMQAVRDREQAGWPLQR